MLTQTCGGCDVSTDVFISELQKYVQLKMKALIVGAFVDAMNTLTDVNFFMDLVMKLAMEAAFDGLRRDLQCDYGCLFANPPPGMMGDLAVYYVTAVSLVIVDIGYRYDGCDVASSGSFSSAAFQPAR